MGKNDRAQGHLDVAVARVGEIDPEIRETSFLPVLVADQQLNLESARRKAEQFLIDGVLIGRFRELLGGVLGLKGIVKLVKGLPVQARYPDIDLDLGRVNPFRR